MLFKIFTMPKATPQKIQHKITTIKDNSKVIRNIYHLADIHIKDSEEYEKEYTEVFNKFFAYLKNEPNKENSIVVICGDIMHNKCLFTHHSLEVFFNFMETITQYMDAIVIFGNHDGSVVQKKDGIYPILSRIKNVYYLMETGEYKYNNIVFGVSSLLDGKLMKHCDIQTKDKISIALYHGMLSGVKLHNYITTEGINKQTFDGYDFALLGDIHKHQYITPTIAYSGSLLQQNFGEDVVHHGFIKWDILSKKSKFIAIPNNYAYIKLNIENNVIINMPPYKLLKPKITVTSKNTTKSQCIDLINKFYPQHTKLYIEQKNSKVDEGNVELIENKLHDVDYQSELIKAYCKKHFKIDDTYIENIINFHHQMTNKLNSETQNTNTWKLKNLKFSNLFSYGENNEIDFESFNQTISLRGENHIGKSALIDIILYAIYGKCSRGKNNDIINIDANNMVCIITLEMNNVLYKITRIYSNEKSMRANINVYFTKIEKGEHINISGVSKPITEDKIVEYFGTYENLIETSFYLQNEEHFIFQTEAKQMNIMTEHCGIRIFEEMRKNAIAEKNIVDENYRLIRDEVADYDKREKPTVLPFDKKEIENQMTINKNKLNDIDNEIHNLYQKRKNITKEEMNEIIDELNGYIGNDTYNNLVDKVKVAIDNLNNKIKYNENEYNQINNDELLKKITAYEHYIDQNSIFDKDIIENELKYIEEAIQMTINLTSNGMCNKCNTYNNLCKYQTFYNGQKQIKSEQLINANKCDKIEIELEKLQKQLSNNETKSRLLKQQTENDKIKISDIQNSYQTLLDYMQSMDYDRNINIEIDSLRTAKKFLESEIDELKAKLSQIIIMNNSNAKLDEYIEDKRKQLIKLTISCNTIEKYIEIMSKNGLFIVILRPFVKLLESKMNNILSSITNFNIQFDKKDAKYNKKNDKLGCFEIFKTTETNKLLKIVQTSGSEIFITTFAFKLALMDITKCPKPDFFILDEAFSCISDHYLTYSLPKMINMLESKHKFSLIVDHNEKVKSDCAGYILVIKDKNNLSQLYDINENIKTIVCDKIKMDIGQIIEEDYEESIEEYNPNDYLKEPKIPIKKFSIIEKKPKVEKPKKITQKKQTIKINTG